MRESLSRATALLKEAGVDSPRLDAELLLAEAMGVSRAALVIDAGEAVPEGATERYRSLLSRRLEREPVAYLLGRRAFRRIELMVDRRVLIPRPESELLVELAVELAQNRRVADVGTGSGAVALAVKDERPDLAVTGLDLSEDALDVARLNAEQLGLEVSFRRCDLLDEGPYDALLANLPYVPEGERLAPEIERHEPGQAVFAGRDGLDLIRRLVSLLGKRSDVQVVGLEVGAGQAPRVRELLLGDGGFSQTWAVRDLAGIERLVGARR